MRRLLAVLTVALVLSFLIYPSAFIYGRSTLPDNNDTRLIAYIISQVQNNLFSEKPLHFGTFFAPYENTLTYSDLFLTTAVLTLPFRLATSSPIVIFNLAYMVNSSLTFLVAFYFFRVILNSGWRALTAVFILFLSGYHLIYLPHLQVYSLWAAFASLYFFHRRAYFLFFAAVTFQMADSFFPLYLVFFYLAVSTICEPRLRPNTKTFLVNAAPFPPIWYFLLIPYFELTRTIPEAVRPIRDAAHFSLGLEEIFTKFHSWTLILLFFISLLFCHPRPDRGSISIDSRLHGNNKKSIIHNSSFVILVFSLIMSLGPVLKIFGQTIKIFGLPIPLPYAAFYYLLPGFQGLRTPSRFIILAALAATVIIVSKLEPFFNKLKSSTKLLILISFILILLVEAEVPRPGYAVNPTPPTVYEAIKKLPPGAAILELPVLLWNDPGHEIESLRSLYSLGHGRRRLGGFSGFAPMSWINLVNQINTHGLTPKIVARLKILGITHLVQNNTLQTLPNR